ncbi:MAG: molybdate ABC transporter substrate-binding protein [Halanaerobium sp.]
MMNLITKKQFIKILLITLLIISIFSFQLGAEESQIRVMAAASLTEVFTEFAEAYERAYGTRVELNFAGSQALYSQLKMGVRADIFASANLEYMTDLEELELVGSPKIFAENKLVIAAVVYQTDITSRVKKEVKL